MSADKDVALGRKFILALIGILIIIVWAISSPLTFFPIAFISVVIYITYKKRMRAKMAKSTIHEIGQYVLGEKENIHKSEKPSVKKLREAAHVYNAGKYEESVKIVRRAEVLHEKEENEKERKRLKEERKKKEELFRQRKRLKEERKKKEELFRKTQLEKGLIFYKNLWITKEKYEKVMSATIGLENNFKDMQGWEFEKFVAKLFEKMGYKTRITKGSGDFGIDVIAKNGKDVVAIQVKRWGERQLVTPDIVQRTIGAMNRFGANKCMVITTSDFTVAAKEAAKGEPIELWDKEALHKFVKKYFIQNELKQT